MRRIVQSAGALCWLGVFSLTIWVAVPRAGAHNPVGSHRDQPTFHFDNGDWVLQSSGIVEVGRDRKSGGFISVIRETGGPKAGQNIVNHWDNGRQTQINIRAGRYSDPDLDWNPTQGGDGGGNYSGTEIFYVHPDYIYSKCVPLLFHNPPHPQEPLPWLRREAPARFYMTTEFLPGSGGRAFLVGAYYEYWGEESYEATGQHCIMNNIMNLTMLNGNIMHYDGNAPWTGGTLSEYVDPTDDENAGTHFFTAEGWTHMIDGDGWGLGLMTHSSYASARTFLSNGILQGEDDHINMIRMNGHLERFCVARNNGEAVQVREGRSILYMGDYQDARAFFSNYRPRLSGSFADNFDDSDIRDWDVNARFVDVINGAIRMGADDAHPADISLPLRTYGDCTIGVDIKLESTPDTSSSWYGFAFRKVGGEHFRTPQSRGYFLLLRPSGQASILATNNGGTVGSVRNINHTLPDYDPYEWNRFNVVADGFNFEVQVNGATIFTQEDPEQRHASGYISLGSFTGNTVWFDNFTVTTETGDGTPPAPVTGLAGAAKAEGEMALAWTNPADEDWRWTRVVRKVGGYPSHHRDGLPIYEGKLSGYTDPDITPGEEYYYAVYTVDHAGNYAAPVYYPSDSDGDAVPDEQDPWPEDSRFSVDTDGDGLDDAWEVTHGFDPALQDEDDNGVPDGEDDADHDGQTNSEEMAAGSDPRLASTLPLRMLPVLIILGAFALLWRGIWRRTA